MGGLIMGTELSVDWWHCEFLYIKMDDAIGGCKRGMIGSRCWTVVVYMDDHIGPYRNGVIANEASTTFDT